MAKHEVCSPLALQDGPRSAKFLQLIPNLLLLIIVLLEFCKGQGLRIKKTDDAYLGDVQVRAVFMCLDV